MKNMFMKRLIVSVLLASWFMQPVMAVTNASNWQEITDAMTNGSTSVDIVLTGNILDVNDNTITNSINTIINGSGFSVDASHSSRPFINYGSLTLKNIILENAYNDGVHNTGGVIRNYGNLVIGEGTVIRNNTATGRGGAVYLETGSDLTVENGVQFIGNKALDNPSAGGMGGAINVNVVNTPVTIKDNVVFQSNYARSGGAIFHSYNENDGTEQIMNIGNNVQFVENVGFKYAGAIHNKGVMTIGDNATFKGNRGVWYGGAIVQQSHSGNKGRLSITIGENSKFYDNGSGTGIDANNNSTSYTTSAGGAIYAENGGSFSIEKNATFGDSVNGGNKAGVGGAIYNAGTMSIDGGASFDSNEATSAGGAIANAGTLSLDTNDGDITFSNNTANGVANDIHLQGTDESSKAVLNVLGNSNSISLNAITGNEYSEINKTQNNTLALNGDNSAYNGQFNQSAGMTTVASGAKFFGGTNNISGGEVQVSGTLNGTNNLTGGSIVTEDGSTLSGSTNIAGGSMTIKGGTANSGAIITFKNAITSLFSTRAAGDTNTLTLDTTDKALTLDATVTQEAGATGTVEKVGSNELIVNTSQNDFTGTFNNEAGTTSISGTDKKFFGGTNNINAGTLNVSNGAALVAGSTTNVGSSSGSAVLNINNASAAGDVSAVNNSQVNISNSATVSGNVSASGSSTISVDNAEVTGATTLNNSTLKLDNNASVGAVEMQNNSTISINSDAATADSSNITISSAIQGAAGSNIILDGGNLTISGDQSNFVGLFTQNNGTTTVSSGATFFGGTNTIKVGEFIFASDAILSNNVTVEDDAILTITGSADKTFDGNTLIVGNNTSGFVLNKVDMTGEASSINTKADNFSGDITFSDGAGLVSGADVTLTKVDGKSGKITMADGSVSADGSVVALTAGTSFDITASDFDLYTDISSNAGVGTVNVADTVQTLDIFSDNSGFNGVYNQEAGAVSVKNGAKFFNGTNNIKAGSVTFENGSTLYGNNILTNAAQMTVDNGAVFDSSSIVDLQSETSGLSFVTGGTYALDSTAMTIKGSGTVSNAGTLNLNNGAKVSDFSGTYNQTTGGSTVVDNTAFFSGTNTIDAGSVEFKNGATVAGKNTLNNTSSYVIHDGSTIATGTTINLANQGASLYFGDDTDVDSAASTSLNIALQGVADSNVYKNGAGILNITADQSGYGGNFTQNKGIINLANKFFNTASIASGVLNLNSGSDISASIITLGADADLNILANTTINKAITGATTSDINVGSDSQNPTVAVNIDQSAYNGNYTQNNGTVNVSNGFFGGVNKIFGGIVNLVSGATLKGQNTIGGGTNEANVKLTDAAIDSTATITLADKGTLEFADTQARDLSKVISGTSGTVLKSGAGDLNVNVDQNAYQGAFTQTQGTTNVDGTKFFGGTNNINTGELNLKNSAELASGSTTNLNNTSKMNVSNGSSIAGNVVMNNNSSIVINNDSASDVTISGNISSGTIAQAADQQITLEQGTLTISGNQSGYKGTFTQNNGKTVVTSTGTFFGGINNIENGIFQFDDGAQLASNININNQNIELIIGGTNKTLNGNILTVNGGSYGFVLNNALITGTDSLITSTGNNFTGHMTFKDGAGVGTGAEIELSKGTSTSGHLTFSTDSAASGGTVTLTDANAKVDIVADNSNFNTAIAGSTGTVTVKKETAASTAPAVTIASNNSGFTGNYKQQDGSDVTITGQFFGGTNTVDASKLTFNSGSTLNGDNIFSNAAELLINSGTTDNGKTIKLNDTSVMKLEGTDFELNSIVSGANKSVIENALTGTFTVNSDNTDFLGTYTQSGSATTVKEGAGFFGGTNTINGGSVTFESGSTIAGANTLNNDSVMTINNGTTYNTGTSVVVNNANSKLVLNSADGADMSVNGLNISGTQGTVEKTGTGTLNIDKDQTFTGTYTQAAGTVNVSNKFFGGTNNINAGTLNMQTGSTFAGNTAIAQGAELVISNGVNRASGYSVSLADGSILTINPASNTSVALSDFNNISVTGTTTQIKKTGDGTLVVDAGNSITGNNFAGIFNQTEGITNVSTDFFVGTNNLTGGTVNFIQDGVLFGNNNINGATVNINDGSSIGAAALIAMGSNGILNFNGTGTVENSNAQTLSTAVTGNAGQINKTGTGDLVLTADQSGFTGEFNQKDGGSTVVQGNSFFGGTSNIEKGTVELKDGSSIAAGSAVNMSSGTQINVSGSVSIGESENTTSQNIISNAADAEINLTGDGSYLTISGDQSSYKGIFSQDNKSTTEVLEGATFFGGSSTIYDGYFIFRDNAKLAENVLISGEDVVLTIGDGTTSYVIKDGNRVYVDETPGAEKYFILENLTIKDTALTGDQTLTSSLRVSENAGFDSKANYTLAESADGKHGNVTLMTDSYTEVGSKMDIEEGSKLTINAEHFLNDATKGNGQFNMELSGNGTVEVKKANDDAAAPTFDITSDNSNFVGRYVQNAGNITMVDGSAFFGGTNEINNGTVTFENGSSLYGNNTINAGATMTFEGGSSIENAVAVAVNDGGNVVIDAASSTVFEAASSFTGSGTISNTSEGDVTISANQDGFTGVYNQTGAGTVTIAEGKSFFGGTNTISAGTVDASAGDSAETGAILKGANTVNGTGKIVIGDFTDTTGLTGNKIVLDSADAYIELNTKEGNDKNLDVAFNIVSGENGNGNIVHTGDGALNLNNAGANDLFANFNGTFTQNSTGITNVFGKSFKNNVITNGILNLKDDSELLGTTEIASGAALNIGTLEDDTTVNPVEFTDTSKVTISGNVTGAGNVAVSQGEVTIKGTSQNDGFNGNYTQSGGTVTAEKDSTFFGGTNLIEKGKLIFKKEAKLATGSNVELKGDSTVANNDAVLDLDGRTDAVFNGVNLYIDGNNSEGFVFTDGVLTNATLTGEQSIGNGAVVTFGAGSGLVDGAEVTLDSGKLIFATGSSASETSTLDMNSADSVLNLSSTNLAWYTIVSGTGAINVEKDVRETAAPKVTIYGDQSRYTGSYTQEAGTVTVTADSVFFKGDGSNINVNGGNLILDKGALLSGDINVNGAGGATDKHGRVWISDKIYDDAGVELTDIDKLMSGDLYYNTKADGSEVDKNHITIANGGLILSNGTVFDGSQGVTVFDKVSGGVVDIGFSNGTGVNGDIELREDTMLSYGDNAFIKDDSTLVMDDNAILNFINQETELTYNPTITGGGAIYKEGAAATNVSSAIDMKGEVNVKEGTLNFTNKDKVSFSKTEPDGGAYGRQTGNLTVGSDSSNAVINIVAKETSFGGDVNVNAQDGTQSGLNLLGENTTIGGSIIANNAAMHITGNTTVGGDLSINGNSGLNLIGNTSNTLTIAGDMILGDNLKDGKLPVAFDYNPHQGTMDKIVVDSFVNDSNAPLLITGINFVTSPADRVFNLDATSLIQQNNPQDTPYYDPTGFYANTAMGRYYLTNGAAGGSKLTGTLVYLNPQQYRGQVATIATWQNQLVVNNMLFDHMDVITRQLMDEQKTANKYAAAYPQFAPYQYDLKGGSLWYKAYGNFETLSMTKGLNVRNNAYGSLIGADFPLIKLKHGWNLVPTAYIGYNGAHQTFDGVSMYQNGAQLGIMGTAYKGDFITSLLAYGGGYANDMSVKGGAFGTGSDTTGNWFAGVASKTAYNVRLPKDFIFQPTFLMSYNAFGNQNWGSNFGVLSMNSGMLNGINIAPGFNFIWQKKTFNIYATAQMVYNIMGVVDGRAGNVDLGNVRMRHSYFEYGLGVSKSFKERFMGYLQFTIRNGGRTGIGFQGGLNYKIGK